MSKFLKVEVTRTETTDLYIEVHDDFNGSELRFGKYRRCVAAVAKETTDDYDWDSHEWEDTVEVQTVCEVDESEAVKYKHGKLDLSLEVKPRIKES